MKENILSNFKNILAAEDDADFFFFFKAALLSMLNQVNVMRTSNGMLLLSIIETSIRPDIIFLDINMPFKSGIECLEEIKKKDKFNTTKVVMCSTSDSINDINNCYNNGADFYFIKPSNSSSLHRKFEDLFNKCLFFKNQRTPRPQFVLN